MRGAQQYKTTFGAPSVFITCCCVRLLTELKIILRALDDRCLKHEGHDHVGQGKSILQLQAGLKDSSRLNLIEIPFVAFDVLSVSSVGRLFFYLFFERPSAERRLLPHFNKQIRFVHYSFGRQ